MARRSASKPPSRRTVAAHPLFPAAVALWSAALAGLGSLAVHPALLGGLVARFRLDQAIPALAGPLGMGPRVLLAAGMAAAGAAIGAALAHRVAARARQPRGEDGFDLPARRPISAHEELGSSAGAEPAMTWPGDPDAPASECDGIAPVPVPLPLPLPAAAPDQTPRLLDLADQLAAAMQRRRASGPADARPTFPRRRPLADSPGASAPARTGTEPAATEQALRSALERLQRIRGAA